MRTLGMTIMAGVVAALTGCAAQDMGARSGSPGAMGSLEFDLVGGRIIGCCCNTPCPCRVNHKPTHCHGCDYTTAVHVDKGQIDGVRMDGLTWAVVGRGFGEDPKQGWHYVYFADKATPEQEEALKKFLTAGVEGIREEARPYLVGTAKGMRRAPITWTASEGTGEWSCTIDKVLELRSKTLVLPGRKEPATLVNIFDDFGNRLIQGKALKHTYNDPQIGYQWELTGRQINTAPFHITHARVAEGGIGWGCWSAHADFADTGEYQERSIGHK
jgi:hypothetical protein